MDRNELLRQLLALKKMREMERHRADVVVRKNELESDSERLRFNVALHNIMYDEIELCSNRIKECKDKIQWYDEQVEHLCVECVDVQRELPVELTLDLTYIDCAIDDVVMSRVTGIKGLITMFSLRYELRHGDGLE